MAGLFLEVKSKKARHLKKLLFENLKKRLDCLQAL